MLETWHLEIERRGVLAPRVAWDVDEADAVQGALVEDELPDVQHSVRVARALSARGQPRVLVRGQARVASDGSAADAPRIARACSGRRQQPDLARTLAGVQPPAVRNAAFRLAVQQGVGTDLVLDRLQQSIQRPASSSQQQPAASTTQQWLPWIAALPWLIAALPCLFPATSTRRLHPATSSQCCQM
mgnify:CR=1 FL=1